MMTTFANCELFGAGNVFQYVFEMYYNNYLYANFGVHTFAVKNLRLTGNINCGHFDVYLSISNILNVTENVIVTLEGNLSIYNNISV